MVSIASAFVQLAFVHDKRRRSEVSCNSHLEESEGTTFDLFCVLISLIVCVCVYQLANLEPEVW
jgi:hypothetical protein